MLGLSGRYQTRSDLVYVFDVLEFGFATLVYERFEQVDVLHPLFIKKQRLYLSRNKDSIYQETKTLYIKKLSKNKKSMIAVIFQSCFLRTL